MGRKAFWMLGCLLLSAMLPGQGAAAADFYAGKTIEFVVPFKEGGGTDIWARVIAPYLQKHIGGNPKILIRNVPGGESIHGVNQYMARAKADGLNMVVTSATQAFHVFLGVKAVQYDFAKLRPLIVNPVGGAVYVAPSTGVKTATDLLKPQEKLVFAGMSPTSLDLVALLAFDVLGMDVKGVLGYEGRGPARLAFERGESNIDQQTTPAYYSSVVPLVKSGKAIPVFSFGQMNSAGELTRDPAFPDLPDVDEVYTLLFKKKPVGAGWEAYKAFNAAAFAVQKILWVKKEAPAESIQAVLEAADRMQKDTEFLQKADKVLGGYPVLRGDKIESAIQKTYNLAPEARTYVLDLLKKKYKTEVK